MATSLEHWPSASYTQHLDISFSCIVRALTFSKSNTKSRHFFGYIIGATTFGKLNTKSRHFQLHLLRNNLQQVKNKIWTFIQLHFQSTNLQQIKKKSKKKFSFLKAPTFSKSNTKCRHFVNYIFGETTFSKLSTKSGNFFGCIVAAVLWWCSWKNLLILCLQMVLALKM